MHFCIVVFIDRLPIPKISLDLKCLVVYFTVGSNSFYIIFLNVDIVHYQVV